MHESITQTKSSDQGYYFAVAALGFEERERLLFRNILRISEQHPLEFRPYQPQRDGQPDLVIINADNADAMKRWGQLDQARLSNAGPMSSIYMSRGEPPAGADYHLGWPFLATRLFALLERAVIERHGYEPDLALAADDMLMLATDEAPLLASQIKSVATTPHQSSDEPPVAGRSALLVDDSLPVRIHLKASLEKTFERVDVAETGEAALALLESRTYDLVLLEVILPGIDGYETCKRIKEDSRHTDTVVVMLTSNSSPVDKVKGKLAGCETYLIKPVKASVFESVLSGLVPSRAAA